MLTIYPACFINEKENCSVVFPDWDFASTCGSSFEEAMSMAIDLLAGLIFHNTLCSLPMPEASDIDAVDIKAVANYAECDHKVIKIIPVSVNAEEYARNHFLKCKKKTVTIYEWQDEEGIRQGINFSEIFKEALTKALLHPTQ